MDRVRSYVEDIQRTLDAVPEERVWEVIGVLHEARVEGRKVFVMGNGGSGATASHIVCDLGKGTQVTGFPSFRAIALTDSMPVFSAYANDIGYEHVFARQLEPFVEADDVVIGISGSGNSPNVVGALELARERGALTIGFVGFDGGCLKEQVDICVHVENDCMEQVEDIHVVLGHLIATVLRQMATDDHRSLADPADPMGVPFEIRFPAVGEGD
jgi:D-sedoheptulose 7-phosphate isomerase